MISQKCPRCKSKKVRLGYRPTRWWSRLFARYNLLCDNCNWEFTGFAVPGTTYSGRRRRSRKNADPSDGDDSAFAVSGEENISDNENFTAGEMEEAASEEEGRGSKRSRAAMLI